MQPELPKVGDIIASKLTERIFKVEKIYTDRDPQGTVYQCRSLSSESNGLEMLPEIIVRGYWSVIGKE